MKLFDTTNFAGVAHEFFASLGKTVASAAIGFAIFFLDKHTTNLGGENAALFGSLAVFIRAILSMGKVYFDNLKISTPEVPAVDTEIAG